MTSLIVSGGRRCDPKCWNAEGPDCECVCGGRYHGHGRDGTLADAVEETAETWIEALVERGHDPSGLQEALRAPREKREALLHLEPRERRRRATRRRVRPGQGQMDLDFSGGKERADGGDPEEVPDPGPEEWADNGQPTGPRGC